MITIDGMNLGSLIEVRMSGKVAGANCEDALILAIETVSLERAKKRMLATA